MQRRGRASGLLLTGAVVGAAVSGTAVAASEPDPPDRLVHSCVNPAGALRIVQEPSCRSNESLLTWNQRGPVGPQGPKGDPGLTGPPGPPGTSSLVSPDGRFRVEISNTGVYLRGPAGTLVVDARGVRESDNPFAR